MNAPVLAPASLLTLPTDLRLIIFDHYWPFDYVYASPPRVAAEHFGVNYNREREGPSLEALKTLKEILPLCHLDRTVRREAIHHFFHTKLRFVARASELRNSFLDAFSSTAAFAIRHIGIVTVVGKPYVDRRESPDQLIVTLACARTIKNIVAFANSADSALESVTLWCEDMNGAGDCSQVRLEDVLTFPPRIKLKFEYRCDVNELEQTHGRRGVHDVDLITHLTRLEHTVGGPQLQQTVPKPQYSYETMSTSDTTYTCDRLWNKTSQQYPRTISERSCVLYRQRAVAAPLRAIGSPDHKDQGGPDPLEPGFGLLGRLRSGAYLATSPWGPR